MGREIVRESSTEEPGKRSRLWFHEDVHVILTTNSGTKSVEGLVLKSQGTDRVCFSTDSFKEMKKLRFLQLDCVDLIGDYGNLSKELRWVHWQGFTSNYIPDDFHQGNLVLLNLKILNLSHSRYLKRSPDFSKLPNLEKIIMKDCPTSIDVQKNNLGFRSPMIRRLLRLRTIVVQFHSKNQLTQELQRILDDQYDVSYTQVETSHASQISNHSLRSLLIGMGSFHIVIDTLSKSISQGLTTNDSGKFFLPGDNYPSWLAYTGEGPSIHFQVPEDSDCCMKGITLCVVYSSTSENTATECLASILIINYTKFTVHIYKRDTIMSFNDEDWKNVTSNLGPGDNVEISVAFGHGLIVKETAVYLIYGQSITMEVDADEKDVLKNDVDANSNQRDMHEASKRHEEILNQSEDAAEKGALVNDVDVNRRMAEQISYAVAERLFNRLASAAFREHGQIYGVTDELERLKNSVEHIKVVLLDAQEKQEQNCAVRSWIRRLEDLLHLADDLLDEFIIEGMRYQVDAGDKKKMTWVFRSLSSNHSYIRRTMVPKIGKIQKKFDDVVEEMVKLNLSPKAMVVKQTDNLRSKSISFLLESEITGRLDDKKEIINLLRQPHGNISSIAIVAGNDCCYLDSEAKRCVQRPVHVLLEPSAVHLLDSLDGSRLRTLILLSSNEVEELNGDELLVITKFKHLRALKLSYCSLSKLSSSIGKLKHLRYLNLSHCRGLGSLYKSLSSLVLLQTLILTPNEKVEFSTKVVSKLINLRHLHISDWETSRDETPFGFVKLSIWQHKGMIFSNWISTLTNIVEISFFLCGSLKCLPPLERLPFLKSLHLSFLEELEYIYYEQDYSSAFFPSLESLSLQFCYKLKGWWRMGDDFNNTNCSQNLSLPPFPRLSQLSIIGCLMLTCMPTFPNLESGLELYDSRVETLVATLNTVALESLSDFPPLSMLKSLYIDGVSLNVKSIPEDWMQNLTSLQLLQINWFSRQAFQEIETWFKNDFRSLPSLQTIAFHNCEDLEALPDWICNLSPLQHLRVYDCINLASLPERMPCLTNLQTLEIIGCPLLVEECQTQTGETWLKIGHVPKIILSSLH
ncbi:hypothetical protein P8452_73558 [Trifolium repens]|nr:hypothetical protein P8452_73558 [Trifolium repens]